MKLRHLKANTLLLAAFVFVIASPISVFAIADICPGEPTVLNWSTSNVSGSCVEGWSIAACTFSVVKNTTNSTPISTSNSCNVTLTCDGIQASDSLTINPNQSRCCGNWDLVGTVWDVGSGTCQAPAPTGSLTSSADTCSIATGASTCSVDLTWTTTNPVTTSAITTSIPAPNTVLYSANNDGPLPVSVKGPVSQTFYLYNNAVELAQKTITTSCAAGPTNWDTDNNICANPQVFDARVLNQHYPPGKIKLTCTGATTYGITTDIPAPGTVVVPAGTTYSGPVTLDTPAPYGNSYDMTCAHGSVSDHRVVLYESTLNPVTITFNTGITVVSDPPVDVPLTWVIANPTNACTLTAKVVCANNACSATQLQNETNLNIVLSGSNTDLNDPNTSRPMSTAIKTPAPGHKDSDVPLILADYKALGKKTIQITNTTDLILDCGGNKVTKRIRVTKNEEQ